jgi:dihydrofolate reductase
MFDCGAIITGRRTFDIAGGWGGHHPIGAPFFVLTHEPPGQYVGPGTDGTVVTDGIESALEQARAVAGDRTISVGAADVAQQYLKAGLLDEIHIDLICATACCVRGARRGRQGFGYRAGHGPIR